MYLPLSGVLGVLAIASAAAQTGESEITLLTPSKYEIRSDEVFSVHLAYSRPYASELHIRLSSIGFFEAWGDSQWSGRLGPRDTARITMQVRLRQDRLHEVPEFVPLTLFIQNVPFTQIVQGTGPTITLRVANFRELPTHHNPLMQRPTEPPVAYSPADYVPPQPSDGWGNLRRRMSYPLLAQRASLEGAFLAYVSINARGTTSSVEFDRRDVPVFAEHVREVLLATRWIPAQVKGRPMNTRITIPVVFIIDDYADIEPFVVRHKR